MHVCDSAELEDVIEDLESIERQVTGDTTCRKDKFRVRERLARFCGYASGAEINGRDFVVDGLDTDFLVPFWTAPLDFLRVRD